VKEWERQERRAAETYRGSRSPGSGSGRRRPNDVRNEELLIECKHTSSLRGITILADDLEKLRKNAAVEGRTGVLQFQLGGRTYVTLLESEFLDIYGHDNP
jgi:hypothetical protein